MGLGDPVESLGQGAGLRRIVGCRLIGGRRRVLGALAAGGGARDLGVQHRALLRLHRLGLLQSRRRGGHGGRQRVELVLLLLQRRCLPPDLPRQAAQHEHAAQRVLRRGGNGQKRLRGEERQPLDER